MADKKPSLIDFIKKDGVFTPNQGGGYITLDETGIWDMKKMQELLGHFPPAKPNLQWQMPDGRITDGTKIINPIDDWCQKWIKREGHRK